MQQVDTRLVTPEAVVLQFETAGIGSRFLAKLLDTLVQLALFLVITMMAAAASSGGLGSTAMTIFVLVSLFAVIFVYPAAFETLWRGKTPGKAAIGLRVVTREGSPIRFRHAAIRSALWLIDGLLFWGAIGVISMLVTRDNLRLGDLAAGTLVVRERTGARVPTAVSFGVPYGYEGYVGTLDVSGLTADDYGAVRNLLLRAPTLASQPRWDLSRQLATYVAQKMRHTPPSSVGPELFLACVAAAYQQRHAPPVPPVPPVPPLPTGTEGNGSQWGVRPPAPPTSGGGDFAPPR